MLSKSLLIFNWLNSTSGLIGLFSLLYFLLNLRDQGREVIRHATGRPHFGRKKYNWYREDRHGACISMTHVKKYMMTRVFESFYFFFFNWKKTWGTSWSNGNVLYLVLSGGFMVTQLLKLFELNTMLLNINFTLTLLNECSGEDWRFKSGICKVDCLIYN